MGTANDWIDGLSVIASGVKQKVSEGVDIVSTNAQVLGLQQKMNVIFQKLGKEYYTLYKGSADESLAGMVQEIYELEQKIEELKKSGKAETAETADATEATNSVQTCDSDDNEPPKPAHDYKEEN